MTIDDCTVDPFTVGGPGGGGKDTSNSGARVTHRASGASATCRDHRSFQRNRAIAFQRMANTPIFQTWHRIEIARRLSILQGRPSVEELVEGSMSPENLRIEVRQDGRWTSVNKLDGE